jgi:hypothetical protein
MSPPATTTLVLASISATHNCIYLPTCVGSVAARKSPCYNNGSIPVHLLFFTSISVLLLLVRRAQPFDPFAPFLLHREDDGVSIFPFFFTSICIALFSTSPAWKGSHIWSRGGLNGKAVCLQRIGWMREEQLAQQPRRVDFT